MRDFIMVVGYLPWVRLKIENFSGSVKRKLLKIQGLRPLPGCARRLRNSFGRHAHFCHTRRVIYFRDHHWLPVHGYNQFEALIQTDDRKREDVFWMLNFRCVASGAQWRRVRHWERPSLWLQISSFKPKLRDWRDLELLNFWNLDDDDEAFTYPPPSGLL